MLSESPNIWTLRYYRDSDEEGILDCLTAAFGRWPSVEIDVPPIEHLRWKLSSHPIAPQVNYVAVDGERIIGCQLIIVQRLKDRDRQLLANTCTDYAVHPDYQGRGVSRALWSFDPERFAETFALLINITGSRVVKRQIKKIGWSRPLANTLEWLERSDLASSANAPSRNCEIRTVDKFDSRIDDFCLEALRPFDLAVVRDREYLNWRYADRRAGRYAIRIGEQDGRLLGYAVLVVSRGKGFIADLIVLPGRLDVVDALLEDGVRHFAASGLASVRCWSPRRHPYRDAFLRHGFQPARPVDYLGFGPHRSGGLPPRDDPHASVHFTLGDTDIV